jgi:hypothetical protein
MSVFCDMRIRVGPPHGGRHGGVLAIKRWVCRARGANERPMREPSGADGLRRVGDHWTRGRYVECYAGGACAGSSGEMPGAAPGARGKEKDRPGVREGETPRPIVKLALVWSSLA